MRTYSLDDVHATCKRRDSWWTVYFVDPVACRVALFVANRTNITPNGLTVFSLVLGMASAACLAAGQLAAGAVLFYLSFMIDCVDGKIARLKGTGTPFGLWLDFMGDRIRELCCATGLAYGQYAATGNVAFIVLGAVVAVLDMFRYVNAPQMKRVRETIREEIASRTPPQLPAPRAHQPLVRQPSSLQGTRPAPAHQTEAPPSRPQRPGPRRRMLRRLTRAMARRRVRSHVISGIEFHATVFVIAPLLGQSSLIPVIAGISVLFLTNEIFLVYRMWLFTRRNSAVPKPEESREYVPMGGSLNV
ncbi:MULTISPECIES: CDP-alcohol phosphatidyltransferase family protein [unclassified Nonomuraea]|uniref:CDP-alcohol phosphatidyltransferase family protein n=1 Tax=Nonomuraea sp. NPDC003804 TaxID=3154547 RepID=UPI0033A7A24C